MTLLQMQSILVQHISKGHDLHEDKSEKQGCQSEGLVMSNNKRRGKEGAKDDKKGAEETKSIFSQFPRVSRIEFLEKRPINSIRQAKFAPFIYFLY